MRDGENIERKRKEKRRGGMKGERKREREIIPHNTLKPLGVGEDKIGACYYKERTLNSFKPLAELVFHGIHSLKSLLNGPFNMQSISLEAS